MQPTLTFIDLGAEQRAFLDLRRFLAWRTCISTNWHVGKRKFVSEPLHRDLQLTSDSFGHDCPFEIYAGSQAGATSIFCVQQFVFVNYIVQGQPKSTRSCLSLCILHLHNASAEWGNRLVSHSYRSHPYLTALPSRGSDQHVNLRTYISSHILLLLFSGPHHQPRPMTISWVLIVLHTRSTPPSLLLANCIYVLSTHLRCLPPLVTLICWNCLDTQYCVAETPNQPELPNISLCLSSNPKWKLGRLR